MKISAITIRILVATLTLAVISDSLSAQRKPGADKAGASAPAARREKIDATVTVTDEQGKPVAGALVFSSRLRHAYVTGTDGSVSDKFERDETIKIKAPGFEARVLSIADAGRGPVHLTAETLFTDEASRVETVFGSTDKRRTVGAYSVVRGSEMEKTPTMYLLNSLAGRLGGFYSMDNSSEPGNVSSVDFVRNGGYTVMVDGVERNVRTLEPEIIESVTLLKDATLKSLYGGVNSAGIIMIRTKRGLPYENTVKINFQNGVQMPTRLPGYLNSFDYTTRFNETLATAGYAPVFNPENYRTPGRDEVLYPDVDYYEQFLKKSMNITRMNGQFSGGNEKVRYFAHLGYQNNGGLETYTQYPTKDEIITVRGNVDSGIFDFITLSAGFSGGIETARHPFGVETGDNAVPFVTQFFNVLADTRPNEFPIFIPGARVGQPHLDRVLGGTVTNVRNPYGMLTRTGYAQSDNTYVEAKFTVDADLNKWVKGLVIRPEVSFDFYSILNTRTGGDFAVYELVPGAQEKFIPHGADSKVSTQTRLGQQQAQRNQVFSTTVEYKRDFGKHSVNALGVLYRQRRVHVRTLDQMKRLNTGVTGNYMYDNRYVVEASVNRVGIGSFAPGERFRFLPAAGLGWIISEENFMKGAAGWLDFLKLRGSYGVLGSTSYDANGIFTANLYRDRWAYNGSYNVGGGYNDRAYPSITGNPDLRFQLSHELNAGFEFLALDGALWGSFGWYRNKNTGLFSSMATVTPGVLGGGAALPTLNYGTRISHGWEGEMTCNLKKGAWNVTLGGNFSYGVVDIEKIAEPDYPAGYEGLAGAKRAGDIRGMKVIGTFANQTDIDVSPKQQFGEVLPGDLKYADLNDDGFINDKDRVTLGNSNPAWTYGITLKVEWKGINLDVLGYGLAGFEQNLSGNKYYQIYGNRKYSDAVINGLPNGNPLPALRVGNSANNFKNSDWWIVNGGFFKLRNVELGYTLPHAKTAKIGINSLKFFVRGFNLLTVSKIKDLDPESLTAGITGYPLATTITGGVSFTF